MRIYNNTHVKRHTLFKVIKNHENSHFHIDKLHWWITASVSKLYTKQRISQETNATVVWNKVALDIQVPLMLSRWYSIGRMAPTIMYLVENVDDCAHTKREVALTNVSECVCAKECAYLHSWVFLHLNEVLPQEDDNQRLRWLYCFLTLLGANVWAQIWTWTCWRLTQISSIIKYSSDSHAI